MNDTHITPRSDMDFRAIVAYEIRTASQSAGGRWLFLAKEKVINRDVLRDSDQNSASLVMIGHADEGPDSESEEVASKEQQQRTVPVEDTVEDGPLGLGYGAARRHALELAEDITHNTYEVGQSSRYVPVQQTSEETTTSRLPVLTTWEDPIDASPGVCSSFPFPVVSPASLTVPSPLASPVTTSAATITVDEGKFLEVGAQLKLHVLHDHTLRLDALPSTLFEGYGWVISLEDAQGARTTIIGALWRPVLALEAVVHNMPI
ncbi:hypothetical protein Tco_0794717 [Tanacetum coccineum]